MPFVNVKLIEGVFTPKQKQEMIRKLTDTMVQTRAWLPSLVGLAFVAAFAASAPAGRADDNRAPDVPDTIAVGDGNKVHFHGLGQGVQIYTWDGASWGAAVPDATLFDDEGNIVATHFAGPRWKSNSGSVVLARLAALPVIVDPDAIPWLLLAAVSTEGDGIFAETAFIQRVNTVGGKAPSANGTEIGQVARVPYTADYFFYRQSND